MSIVTHSFARHFTPIINPAFYQDVIQGLLSAQKTLPCKYFYDANGSELFEQICDLKEYYVTRSEIEILRKCLPQMAEYMKPHRKIIEFGAGSGVKTELLLGALPAAKAYIPIDISRSALFDCARRLGAMFPHVQVTPIHDDYMEEDMFQRLSGDGPYLIFFPGSTIGNFDYHEAVQFLNRLHALTSEDGGILIGVDVMKDESILIPAYNDKKGITAAFNKNLLRRINNELEGDFNLNRFSHRAIVNHEFQRVEMHLVSLCNQQVRVGEAEFVFQKGEKIHTENSHKYTLPRFQRLAEEAGFILKRTWMDDEQLFSVHYLKAQ